VCTAVAFEGGDYRICAAPVGDGGACGVVGSSCADGLVCTVAADPSMRCLSAFESCLIGIRPCLSVGSLCAGGTTRGVCRPPADTDGLPADAACVSAEARPSDAFACGDGGRCALFGAADTDGSADAIATLLIPGDRVTGWCAVPSKRVGGACTAGASGGCAGAAAAGQPPLLCVDGACVAAAGATATRATVGDECAAVGAACSDGSACALVDNFYTTPVCVRRVPLGGACNVIGGLPCAPAPRGPFAAPCIDGVCRVWPPVAAGASCDAARRTCADRRYACVADPAAPPPPPASTGRRRCLRGVATGGDCTAADTLCVGDGVTCGTDGRCGRPPSPPTVPVGGPCRTNAGCAGGGARADAAPVVCAGDASTGDRRCRRVVEEGEACGGIDTVCNVRLPLLCAVGSRTCVAADPSAFALP